MDNSAIINRAGDAVRQSVLGDMPHIVSAWNAVQWKTQQNGSGDAQVNLLDPRSINLSSGLLHKPEEAQTAALIREFGISLFRQAGKNVQTRWEAKLCLPDKDQVDAVQEKLRDEGFLTYRELTESFKTALDRLVSLNVCNALLANNVPRSQSRNVNIFTWGSTAEYANLKRFHSIKPLLFAYTEREIADCPGRALAALVVNALKNVRESSVAAAFEKVIVDTFRACR